MAETSGRKTGTGSRVARVCLLIPTHALPPLSYTIPAYLERNVRVGTAVIVPLSGYSRLGIVVGFEDGDGRDLEEIRAAREELSLPSKLVYVCRWVCKVSATPLATVLRAALPPGLNVSNYRVLAPGWTWKEGSLVSRTALRRALGGDGVKAAELQGRLELSPSVPGPAKIEWARALPGKDPDLRRAPRQRELYEALSGSDTGRPVSALLSETGARREVLRQLVRRGLVALEERPGTEAVFETTVGRNAGTDSVFDREIEGANEGGAWLWRTPTDEQPDAVAAAVRWALSNEEQALVLVPEIETAERLARYLRSELPAGHKVAAYHSGLGRGRAAVYGAAKRGEADVVVGTRAAVLLPLARPGTICVVDEPDEAHRAEPGYEGLQIHVRDVAIRRAVAGEATVLLLSPHPTLRLYADVARGTVRELPPRPPRRWPSVRVVDLRGSGTTISSTLIDVCRRSGERRVGVVANRLGYATAVACNRCGEVRRCPGCDLPLTLFEASDLLVCGRCGHREEASGACPACGSGRVMPTGLAVERVRAELSAALGGPVGLLTARERDLEDAPVVVGTAHCILERKWDVVLVPDADTLLQGGALGAVERAFRLLYGAAEAAREGLYVQTRVPDHYALQAAVRADYPAFASVELPRLEKLGYPPFAHLADVVLEGGEAEVRRAVESRLRPALGPDVEMLGVAPLPRAGGNQPWRVLLRSASRPAVARAGALVARMASGAHGPKTVRVRVNVDPEEV